MPGDRRGEPTVPRPFRPPTPIVIGILGGVASGKSAVANLFVSRGLRHVDADALGREVAGEPAVLAAVAAAFGPQAVRNGAMDRAEIGRVVFQDPGARRRLEAILHPPILARIDAALRAARAAGASVLLDAPLLLETGLDSRCDLLVFVAADAAVRAQRAAQRGWSADELARREAAQLPLAEKRTRAQFAIENSGPLPATERQVADLLDRLASPHS